MYNEFLVYTMLCVGPNSLDGIILSLDDKMQKCFCRNNTLFVTCQTKIFDFLWSPICDQTYRHTNNARHTCVNITRLSTEWAFIIYQHCDYFKPVNPNTTFLPDCDWNDFSHIIITDVGWYDGPDKKNLLFLLYKVSLIEQNHHIARLNHECTHFSDV